jgi:hypothetical protein
LKLQIPKSLKTGKSRDPKNWICDIFHEGVIGTDLKKSLLLMLNQMKDELTIPDEPNDKTRFKNWRGIYVTSVLWKVLMKMIYERTYKK